MIIQVYESNDDKCTTVILKGSPKDEDCQKLIREIEGVDYDDCMRKHYELMGWGEYVPFTS